MEKDTEDAVQQHRCYQLFRLIRALLRLKLTEAMLGIDIMIEALWYVL